MPEIETFPELFDRLGDVATAPDPVAELRAQGFTLSPAVQARLDAADPRVRLRPEDRQRLARLAGGLGPVQFRVADAAPPMVDALPEGEYDIVIALRLALVAETLAALSQGMRYPRELTDGIGATFFTRAQLDALSDDVPSGARIGPLRLTGPLGVSAVAGTDHVILTQEFSLDFRSTILFGPNAPREITVSSLNATARFGVAVRGEVVGDELSLDLEGRSPFTNDELLQLTVATDSPIQPRSTEALAAFAAEIDLSVRNGVPGQISDAVGSICPTIQLPIGAGVDVTVHDIGVRTHRSMDGDVIVVGVRLGTAALPVEDAGDPEKLGNPFSGPVANTYVRAHEALIRKIVKQAHAAGVLEDEARKIHGDLRVDGADAQLNANELRLILDVRVVNACGFLVDTIDINARVTITYRFTIFQGQLFVTRSSDVNVSNLDAAACVVTEGLQFLFLGAVVGGVMFILQYIRFSSLLDSGSDERFFEILSAVFDSAAVPGTEVLLRAEAVQGLVSEDRMESLGILSLRPDDINTYFYVQFMRRSPQFGGAPTPIGNAFVQLVDQDRPPPPDDDAQPPAASSTTTTGDDVITHRRVSFEPPTRDQVLAVSRTDSRGRVQFVLEPEDLRNAAGSVVTTITTEEVDAGGHSTTTRELLSENLPDVYFLVTPQGGVTFSTRPLEGGFVPNLSSRRLGSPLAPLTFFTGQQLPETVDTDS